MKIFRIYFLLIKYDIKSQLKYPLDFLIQIVVWGIYTFVPFFAILILFEQFGQIGIWTKFHIGILYAILGLSYDISRMIGRGLDNFHKLTIKGDLDKFYIRPHGLKVQILGNNFFLRRLAGIMNYLIILVYSVKNLKDFITFSTYFFIGVLLLVIISTICLFLSLLFIYASTCIFTIHRNIFSDLIIDNLAKIAYLPYDYINKILKFVFKYILPVYFLDYLPIKYLLFDSSKLSVLLATGSGIIIAVFLLFISLKIFNFSLRFYQSTGS